MTTAPGGLRRQVRSYDRRTLVGDVVAGVTVAALVLPLSMGLAVTAGLPPIAGLYASMLPMAVFALVATSRQTMVGPDASVTALVAASVVAMSDGDVARHAELVAALAIAAGAWCVAAALVGAGRLAWLLREATLTGYLAGLAIVVGIAQLPRMVGIAAPDAERTLLQLVEVLRELPTWNVASSVLAISSFTLVVVARARRPALPWMLVAVTFAAVASELLDLPNHGVDVVGDLPDGLPVPALPSVSLCDVLDLLPLAAAITLVTFADTVATARAFALRNGYGIQPGRDLVALGLADAAAGLSGGMPVSASGARTAAADSSGGTTQVIGLVAAVVLALVLLGGGNLLATLPQPALGAIVVAAVLPMVDVQSLARLRALDHPGFAMALVVTASVVLIGVFEGIVVAFAVSVLDRAAGARRRS